MRLAPDEVHVWWTPLPAPAELLPALRGLLSPDERDRAARFVFDRHRDDYVSARGRLRMLLAEYVGASPAEIRFAYGAHGKPGLQDASRLRFNVSHTDGIAIFAFSLERDLGVDVEGIRSDVDILAVARTVFPSEHVEVLRHVPRAARAQHFFRLWTSLEAAVKATGAGLSSDTRQLDLSFDLARARVPAFATFRSAGCSLRPIDVGPAHVATLAVATDDEWRLRVRRVAQQ
jgi:4'-phosphopantetheinyl transferase